MVHHVDIEGQRTVDMRLIGRMSRAASFLLWPCSAGRPSSAPPGPRSDNGTCLRRLGAAPGAVGPHEEDLSRTVGPRRQQRHAAELVLAVFMHGQHFRAGPCPKYRGVPLEAGQSFPDFQVLFLGVGQFGQEAAPADFRKKEMTWRGRSPAIRLGFVQHHRVKSVQLGLLQGDMPSPRPGHEDDAVSPGARRVPSTSRTARP